MVMFACQSTFRYAEKQIIPISQMQIIKILIRNACFLGGKLSNHFFVKESVR